MIDETNYELRVNSDGELVRGQELLPGMEDAEGERYTDARLAEAERAKEAAQVASEDAAEGKRHAAMVAKVQARRLAYWEVRLATERARAESIQRPDEPWVAMDANDHPDAYPIGTWTGLLPGRKSESVLYAVYLNGIEAVYDDVCGPYPESGEEVA
jgi:hypothetical protein